jgi:site-specific DNA-methyltransferase (cytosine-N4-specific)
MRDEKVIMSQAKSKSQKPLIEQLANFLEPASYDTTYLTHGIHPYPAKYIPQLPRAIILEHTNERNTVLDPFCGSGTTLLVLQRDFHYYETFA